MTDLLYRPVLVGRRTRTGWIDLTVEAQEERPEPVNLVDTKWPADSERPIVGWKNVTFGTGPSDRHRLICSDPLTPAWSDNGWPQRTSPDRCPLVWLQTELGTRVVGEFVRANPPTRLTVAA